MDKILEYASHYNGKDFVVKVNEKTNCWECISHKSRQNTIGYIPYKGTYAHRYFYVKLKNKEIDENMVIRHICNNPKCCNPDHLETGTQKDNMRDKCIAHRNNNGTNTHLSIEQIKLIAKDNRSITEIAKDYNIHHSTVSRIKNNSTYKVINKEIEKRHCGKKLDKEKVLKIYNSNTSVLDLAKEYNVSARTIYEIKEGRTWSKITGHKKENL